MTPISLFCDHQKNTEGSLIVFEQKLGHKIPIWYMKQIYFFKRPKKGNTISLQILFVYTFLSSNKTRIADLYASLCKRYVEQKIKNKCFVSHIISSIYGKYVVQKIKKIVFFFRTKFSLFLRNLDN